MTTRQSIQKLMAELNANFAERSHHVELTMLAILARVHVLLVGPPGTAKSLMTRTAGQAVGGVWWEKLMTRFTAPDELFGPPKFSALKQDRFEREITGTLLTAHFPFVDEVFKAGSAILNTLLTAMNERVFHNGSAGIIKLPLITLFGASNELPEGKELEALFDRFLVRLYVPYVTKESSKRAIIKGAGHKPLTVKLTLEELAAAQAEVDAIPLNDSAVDAALEIQAALAAEGIVVSDRRLQQVMALVRAAAWMYGDAEATREHLAVVTDALWREPKERAKVAAVVGKVADPVGLAAVETIDAARELAAKVSALKVTDRGQYLKAAGDAQQKMDEEMFPKLAALAKGASSRAAQTVADAKAELTAIKVEMSRGLGATLGLGGFGSTARN